MESAFEKSCSRRVPRTHENRLFFVYSVMVERVAGNLFRVRIKGWI
jgi:hypothetical protein